MKKSAPVTTASNTRKRKRNGSRKRHTVQTPDAQTLLDYYRSKLNTSCG